MTSKASSSLLAASLRAGSHTSRPWLAQRPPDRRPMSSTFAEEEPSHSRLITPKEQKYRIQTAILLNRSPMLTHPPTAFEAAYYEYNSRIARALFNPFPHEFYFKPGSLLEKEFRREDRQREMEAFNWGKKRGSRKRSSGNKGPQKNLSSAIGLVAKEEEEPLMPRRTEADEKGDVKSLDRKGHRNLYLLIKKSKGRNEWKLPGGTMSLEGQELLHETAQRELHAECGVNLDAWIVGRHPIGSMDERSPLDNNLSTIFAECKTFIFKAHILAGQVDPSVASLADFAWLTKREIKRAVTPDYWTNIQDILSDF